MKTNTVRLLALVAVALAFGIAAAVGHPFDLNTLTAGGVGIAMLGNVMAPEELKKLEEALAKKAGEVVETVQKALKDEVEKFGTLNGKTNEKITEVSAAAKAAVEAISEFKQRMTDVEQKLAQRPGPAQTEMAKSVGEIFVESDAYKHGNDKKWQLKGTDPVQVGHVYQNAKTALLNAQGQNQPLVPDMRVPGIITPAERRLTIRDLLPQLRTTSNLIQFASESGFTNNAAIQFSSPDSKENVAKPESALSFSLSNAAVETIAHWIPVSRQLLADAPGLQSYIDSRLTYGLKLKEETQILLGDGQAGSLNGLYTQAAAYVHGVSNDTRLDMLLKMILQVATSEYAATGFVLNPIDWFAIRGLKDTQGRYLIGQPQDSAEPRVWGLPVVATNSQTAGTALCGAFATAAAIWDREDVTMRVLDQHDDFAVKNMMAILVEERMTLTVYRTSAMVKGSLPIPFS